MVHWQDLEKWGSCGSKVKSVVLFLFHCNFLFRIIIMVTKNAGLFYLRYFFFRCVKFSYEFGTSHKTVVALTVLPGKAKRKVSSEISSWIRLRNRFVTIQRRPFCFLKQ